MSKSHNYIVFVDRFMSYALVSGTNQVSADTWTYSTYQNTIPVSLWHDGYPQNVLVDRCVFIFRDALGGISNGYCNSFAEAAFCETEVL